jgi:pentatricopeptide repeat protein
MEVFVTTDGIDSGSRIRTYPDRDGFFTIRGIPSATHYDVALDVPGFDPVRERLESASFSGGIANVVLLLRPTSIVEKESPRQPEGTNPNVIDLGQIETPIPAAAYRLYELAIRDAAEGDFVQAAERLEEAVELAPRFHEAQNNLGVQYLRLGRHEAAIHAFERAIESNPNETEPRINLASVHLERAEVARTERRDAEVASAVGAAIALLREAVALDPHSAEIRLSLGAALYDAGAYDEASAELNHALDLAPEIDSVWLTLVNVYTQGRRYDEALRVIDQFLRRRPETPRRMALEEIRSQIEAIVERQTRDIP